MVHAILQVSCAITAVISSMKTEILQKKKVLYAQYRWSRILSCSLHADLLLKLFECYGFDKGRQLHLLKASCHKTTTN